MTTREERVELLVWGEDLGMKSSSSETSDSSESVRGPGSRSGSGSDSGGADLAAPLPLPPPLPRVPPRVPLAAGCEAETGEALGPPRAGCLGAGWVAGENLEAGFLVRAPLLPPTVKGVWPGRTPRFGRSTLAFRMTESRRSSPLPCSLRFFRRVSMALRSASETILPPVLIPEVEGLWAHRGVGTST